MDARARYHDRDWFKTLHEGFWLRPDEGGEEEADFLRRTLRIRKGQRVLDAPCGAGRVAYHLARHGVEVVGIDLQPAFISRARRRFGGNGVPADLRIMDLRSIEFDSEFHAIYNWFNSFGFFPEEEDADVVWRLARALRPGGRLLIDQVNRERILRNFRPETARPGLLLNSRWDRDRERLFVERVVEGIGENEGGSSQRLYTLSQMRKLLASAGLELEIVLGSLKGEPYRRGSRKMIVVARKGRLR